MQERDFFNEKQETKRASFVCPSCRERADYDVRWLTRQRALDTLSYGRDREIVESLSEL